MPCGVSECSCKHRPTPPPKWGQRTFSYDWEVPSFLGTLSEQQAATAKVLGAKTGFGTWSFIVFYVEA